MIFLKQITIFSNTTCSSSIIEVNDFIKDNKVKIIDIQYSSAGSRTFGIQYSVMIVFEEAEI